MMYKIIHAKSKEHIAEIRKLYIEYQEELGHDLCFQSFEEELNTLPGKYSEPEGSLLLLVDLDKSEYVGCVALRKFENKTCEMKRMYVKPAYRKKGYGKILLEEILKIAKEKKYTSMVLDTLKELKPAIKLYKKYGFTITNSYYENPIEQVVYMRKDLSK